MANDIIESRSMRQLAWDLEADQFERTIGGHQEVVRSIWGHDNRLVSIGSMQETMWIWYGTLSECTRNAPRRACSTEFAMLNYATTLFCLANQMDVELCEAMALKYPGMCFYCRKVVGCTCARELGVRGPKTFEQTARPDVLALSLGGWQSMLKDAYGEGNAERGVDFVMRRLAEEQAELLKAVREKHFSPINEEIADVLAWWFGLATILDLDAPKLLINPLRRLHLPDACFACTLTPCIHTFQCPIF